MNRRHPTTPRAPAHLRARWRDLPRHAALLQRRLGPPARNRAVRATGTALWLLQLTYTRAHGRLLAHGGAVLTVRGPAITLPRVLAAAAVLLLAEVLLITALLLPVVLGAAATAAGAPAPWTRWGATAVTTLFAALLLAGLARQLAAAWPARAVDACRRARLRTGGTWWTVGNLACREDDPVSAAYLVHAALAYADDHNVGAVITARKPALRRTYRGYGFTPDPAHPPAMVRPALGHRTSSISLASAPRAARRIRCRPARPRRRPQQARR